MFEVINFEVNFLNICMFKCYDIFIIYKFIYLYVYKYDVIRKKKGDYELIKKFYNRIIDFWKWGSNNGFVLESLFKVL